jgi:hypothetical protein
MNEHLSENQFTSYVYRTLTDAQREGMDIHLGTCQVCRARLAEHQALHRRARYSILDRQREGNKSSQANFTEVAPRLRRSRRMVMFWTGFRQFAQGAATLAVLVALIVGLAIFFGGMRAPVPGPALQSPVPGTYVKIISLEDTTTDQNVRNFSNRDYLVGQQELILAEGNRYSMISIWPGPKPAIFQVGSYTLTPDGMVFTAEEGECVGTYGEAGTYEWAFDGSDLTLKTVEDHCFTRSFFHTAHPWSKMEYERPLDTYAVTIAQEDVPVYIRDELRTTLPGRWELTLDREGRFSVGHDGTTVSEGRYTLVQGVLSLGAEQGDCTDIGETGHYQWSLEGTVLNLTAVEDWCETRNAAFTLRPLIKGEVSEAAPVLPLGN